MLTAISRQIGRIGTTALLFLVLAGAAAPAQTPVPPPPPAAPALTPAQAAKALEVLDNPQKRADVIASLRAIAEADAPKQAQPVAAAASQPAATTPAPGAPPAAKPTPEPANAAAEPATKVTLAPNSLGAAVLVSASGFLGQLWEETIRATRTVQSIPLLWGWVVVMSTNPVAHDLLVRAAWRVALAAACGLAVQWAARLLVRHPIHVLEGRAGPAAALPEDEEPTDETEERDIEPSPVSQRSLRRVAAATLLRRMPLVLARLFFDLLPILGFAIAGHIVAASPLGGTPQTRLIVIAMIDAYAMCMAIIYFTRMLVSPHVGRLRLLQVSDVTAAWTMRWIRRLAVVSVFGYAIAEVGLLLGMSLPAHDGLLKVCGLINHSFLAIMVLQKRRTVKRYLRAPAGATGVIARLRNAVAPVWHWIALFFLAALWFAWAVEIRDGFTKVLHFFLALVAAAIIVRLALIVLLGSVERTLNPSPELLDKYPGLQMRLRVYHPIIAGVIRVIVYAIALIVLLEFWGVPLIAWFQTSFIGLRLAAGLGTMVLTVVLALLVWEAVNAAIEAHLSRLSREQQVAKSARLRTLMPLLRSSLFVAIVVIAGLTILSEIGINIAPLLAGAGIVGVAIGFGSQKLVQDLITGIFLLLENAMQVGDWVTVSGLSGSVENLSVRTIRLRASDGSVHIIPFSAVTSVTNTNRGLGNAAVSVAVPYNEDTDRVVDALKQIAAEMRKDPDYASRMLSDIQIWGVDKVDGASATITGQIPCTDSGRWPVQREFNRRVKKRFQELGIVIFNPLQTYVVPGLPVNRPTPLPPQEEAAE